MSWEVLQGDCRELMKQIPDGSIDMIWTDPPYGHGNMDDDLQSARVRDGVKGARVKASEPIANDKGADFDRTITEFLDQTARVLQPDCCCCCCCCCGGGGPAPTFAKVANWIDERMAFFHAVVWDKSARGNGMGWRYRRNYEFVMVSHRKGGKLLWNEDAAAIPNVIYSAPVNDRIHPNEKPVDLIIQFLRVHATKGMTVLDPFCGSGSTGVACAMLGINFIGFELDPKYCEIARRRISEAVPLWAPEPVKVERLPELFA